MAEIFFIALCALLGLILFFGIARRGGAFELPFLAAAVYVGWLLPQAYALLGAEGIIGDGLPPALAMAMLALLAICWGWWLGKRQRVHVKYAPLSIDRLFWPVVGVTGFFALMQFLVQIQPDEARAANQWSGAITIFAFFRTVGVVSLAYSILMLFRERSLRTAIVFAVNFLIYAQAVIIFFRRAELLELAIGIVLGLWFVYRWAVPRWAMITGIVLLIPIIFSIHQLRMLTGGYTLNEQGLMVTRMPTLEEIMEIDFLATTPFGTENVASEFRNATAYIEAVAYTGRFSLGAETYNRFIGAYVPGQLVGFDVKESLMIGENVGTLAFRELSYATDDGTTATGFADAFREFWYFGALIFFVPAWLLGRFYRRGMMGSTHDQVMYMSTVVLGLHCITHFSTMYFTRTPILFAAIFAVRALSGTGARRKVAAFAPERPPAGPRLARSGYPR